MRTLYSQALPVKALAIATVQTGTTNGLAIDTAVFNNNFRDVLFTVHSAALTDGSYAVTVEESDASGSGYAAVESWRVQGSLPTFALTDDNVWNSFGVRPSKRYVRVVVTATGATTGGVIGATAVLGGGSLNPPARS